MLLRWLLVYAQRNRRLPTSRLELIEGIIRRALTIGVAQLQRAPFVPQVKRGSSLERTPFVSNRTYALGNLSV